MRAPTMAVEEDVLGGPHEVTIAGGRCGKQASMDARVEVHRRAEHDAASRDCAAPAGVQGQLKSERSRRGA